MHAVSTARPFDDERAGTVWGDAAHLAYAPWPISLVREHESGEHTFAIDVVRVRRLTKEPIEAAAELWRRERFELCTQLRGVALRSGGLRWSARSAVGGSGCDLTTRGR
mmetsp:Transcript_43185/g.143801  ORF Transcript_43185/g.143801 Transcript_43185/m.143801 type:complete len:109 (+) Transcript_43185:90-416(+)